MTDVGKPVVGKIRLIVTYMMTQASATAPVAVELS